MNFSNKLRIIHIFNHLMLIPAFIYGPWWAWIVSFFIWQFIGTIGISLGFHRYLSHQSFETYPWFERVMIYIGCLACGGTPLGWVGTHRLHHRYVDTEKDPHSPLVLGFWRTYFHNWKPFNIPNRSVKDLLRNKHIKICQKHYFKILIGWATILWLIHPLVMIFGFCIPGAIAFHAYSLINAVSHTYGYRSYETKDTSSRNNWFANIFTGGEGWHNNHHKFPSKYRLGLKPWEFDLGAWILERFNLMTSHK